MQDLTDDTVHNPTACLDSFEACRSTSIFLIVPQPMRFTKRTNRKKGEVIPDRAIIASVRKEIGSQIWKQERTKWTETDSDKEQWIAAFEKMCSLQTPVRTNAFQFKSAQFATTRNS